jgi:hypothetical protein
MVRIVEAEVDACRVVRAEPKRTQKLAVKPNALFRVSYPTFRFHHSVNSLLQPELYRGNAVPDPDTKFYLLDRVVNVRRGHMVPLGLRGTVIGIQGQFDSVDGRIDVLFDEPFLGASKLRLVIKW